MHTFTYTCLCTCIYIYIYGTGPPQNPRSAVRYERRPQLHRNTDASVATFRVFQGLSSSGIRDATCRDLMLRSDAPKASRSLIL